MKTEKKITVKAAITAETMMQTAAVSRTAGIKRVKNSGRTPPKSYSQQ